MTTALRAQLQWHVDHTLAPHGWIWVFGSNWAGRHGRGAALVARERYGARTGVAQGLVGTSYALPTKNERFETLPLEQVSEQIRLFVRFTHAKPHLRFFVTRVGCVLAGYKDEQIAPLFRGTGATCSFAQAWQCWIDC